MSASAGLRQSVPSPTFCRFKLRLSFTLKPLLDYVILPWCVICRLQDVRLLTRFCQGGSLFDRSEYQRLPARGLLYRLAADGLLSMRLLRSTARFLFERHVWPEAYNSLRTCNGCRLQRDIPIYSDLSWPPHNQRVSRLFCSLCTCCPEDTPGRDL